MTSKLTKVQNRLMAQAVAVKWADGRGVPLRCGRNGFRTADALIERGLLVEITAPSDFTRWVAIP